MLSTVIITYNNKNTIGKCISSVMACCEEVIVVDSGSSDGTTTIAKNLGASVYNLKWNGYSYAKNYGAQLAKNQWILSIDSDEWIDDQLKNQIMTCSFQKDTIYQFNRLTYIGSQAVKHSGWHPQHLNRIYYKSSNGWNDAIVHERIIGDYEKEILLPGLLHHQSFKNFEDYFKRQRHYACLRAKDWIKKGNVVSWYMKNVKPITKFLNSYLFRLGILDGKLGWIISTTEAKMYKLAVQQYIALKNGTNTLN